MPAIELAVEPRLLSPAYVFPELPGNVILVDTERTNAFMLLRKTDMKPGSVTGRKPRTGFVMMLVLVVGAILVLLGIILFNLVSQQNVNIHLMAYGEMAHFLAEAGINSSIRTVRDSLEVSGLGTAHSDTLRGLLTLPAPLEDTSLMPYLNDTWNADLDMFAKEIERNASVRVEVWLRGFRQTETDPGSWADPGAKWGWLSIESTGDYKGIQRVLTVRRKVMVGNSLAPVVSKFTLHVRDANRGQEARYNMIRNDYNSNIVEGPRPLICYNHNTPEHSIEPKSLAEATSGEGDANVFQERGWIWLGGGKVRLNIMSGAGTLGEIFHFYDVSNPNNFQVIKFKPPPGLLPAAFSMPLTMIWDKYEVSTDRQVTYNLAQGFILEGFHDKSDRKENEAMYEGGILSERERSVYGAKSSMLHLFGEARKGYQSRTKVVGRVMSVFPRFSSLEITPQDSDVQAMFGAQKPPPIYLVKSIPESAWDPNKIQIKDFLGRRFGGPTLVAGFICQDFNEYRKIMSGMLEIPYVSSYNTMHEVLNARPPLQFPPRQIILTEDPGTKILLKRGDIVAYEGAAEASALVRVVESRIQQEVPSIPEFLRTFTDKSGVLQLNGIVRIANPEKLDLVLPPSGKTPPFLVGGGGMIILKEGNLILRGVQMKSANDTLTIVLQNGGTVSFESSAPNQLNVAAPRAELKASAKFDLCGTLAVSDVPADSRFPGGAIRFRQSQDPTKPSYYNFYKIFVEKKDSFWYE